MVVLTSHAETTTDNLLTNKDFDSALDNWTIEDSDYIKFDSSCYNETGLCQSVRWSGDLGKTISQTISNLESNYIVKNVYVSFTALGCNNEATGAWCDVGTDYDKVQTVIELSDGTSQENLYLEQTLDYNDGTQDYSLSTQTLDTWLTNDLTVDFSMTGIDTGNWDGWFGPIVDNINLQLGLEEYIPVVAVVEPTVVEPIVEPVTKEPVVVKVEETKMIEGLDLKTEIVTDVIIDTPAQIDMASVQLPELPPVEINIPETIDMPQEIEMVEEIQEINVEPVEDLVEEVVEQPEELKETSMEEDLAEAKEEVDEPEPEKKESSSKEKKDSDTEEATTEKDQEKSKPKAVAKVNKPVVKANKPSDNADTLGEVILPLTYLQVIQDTIKITETVSLTQEMIYEQDIGSLASSATYDSLISSSRSRFNGMVDVRPKYSFGSYGR